MAYSKQQINSKIRFIGNGDIYTTDTLDATTTEYILTIANPPEIISFQRTGDLQYTVDFSITGKDYPASLQKAVSDETITTVKDNLYKYVKVTRTSGSGKLIILAK